jgi:hypothetical protein
MSGAPHILAARKLEKVPHPPLEDERRPLPTQGEAISKRGNEGKRMKIGKRSGFFASL